MACTVNAGNPSDKKDLGAVAVTCVPTGEAAAAAPISNNFTGLKTDDTQRHFSCSQSTGLKLDDETSVVNMHTTAARLKESTGMRGAPFYMTTSGDGGRSWSKPVAMVDLDGNAMGCARPHLLQLGSAILLSGGRLMMGRDYNDGFSVWLSEDAARTWTRADVSYHHNSKANVSKVPLVPPAVNTTKGSTAKGWFGTSGYAGLVRVGEMSAAILYDWDFWSSSESRSDIHGLHPPYESLAFSMRIDLVSAKQDTPFTPPGI